MNVDDCFRKGLLKKTKPTPKSADESLLMSKKYIDAAKQNLEMENHTLVQFCSNTSMFHAARSLLFKDGVKERSHICIGIYIKEKYKELGGLAKMLDSYRMGRHTAIYSLDAVGSEEESQQAIEDANFFHEKILKVIEKEKENESAETVDNNNTTLEDE